MKRDLNRLCQNRTPGGREGMTLVEVCCAMAVTALLCGSLYRMGATARAYAQHNRIAAEARSLAKGQLEEIISYGRDHLANPAQTVTAGSTNRSTLGYEIVRRCFLVWHDADGAVVQSTDVDAAYVAVRVDVTYRSPWTRRFKTDSFSAIIAN